MFDRRPAFGAGHGHRKPSKVIILCAITIVAFLAWASLAGIDQVSRAGGQVIPAGRVQLVQSNDGGVIQEIKVREGDRVVQGQPLVILDQVRIAASVTEARAKVAALKAEKVRIEAEMFGRPLSFPPELKDFPEFVANERELYTRRRAAQSEDIAALRRMLGLVQRELAMNTPLLQFGDVSKAEVLRIERSAADIEGQIATRQAKYLADLQGRFSQIDQELASAEQTLTQRQSALKDAVIVAPASGIIKNVRLTTVGGVLRPGDEVLEIVPTNDRLIVEAKVSPKDIAYVKVGQFADLKFDAYDSSIYGSAEGRVTYVSPDTLVERSPSGEAAAQVFYRVHITADTRTMHLKPGETIVIQPGMTASAEIKTGRNTVLGYLLKPITKTIGESLGER